MKKRIICLCIVFGAAAASLQSEAYYLELVPIDRNSQSTFYIDIIFNADPQGNSLGNYGFDLYYDNAELTWNQPHTIWSPPPPLFTLFPPFEDPIHAGQIQGISGLIPLGGGGPAEVTGTATLATIAFDMGILRSDGHADIWFDIQSAGQGFEIDNNVVPMSSMPISGEGHDLSATVVPEPAGATLFIAGATAFAMRCFRRKK